MKRKIINFFIIIFLLGICSIGTPEPSDNPVSTDEIKQGRVLTIKEFIQQATAKDTEFENILIDELVLQYQRDLSLPARDIVFYIKTQYDFILDQEREEPEATMTLSKLFPLTGTTISGEYKTTPSYTSIKHSSDMTYSITQPVAQNAFGRSTRMLDKIIGIEVDVAKHQIVEAYEDYFATIIGAYYDWHEAYENLKIGESSYKENVKLLDNIKERQKSKIANPIDVNKIKLQVFEKEEQLIELQELYEKALNIVKTAIRYEQGEELLPSSPSLYRDLAISFEDDFKTLTTSGRTFKILEMLEEKSSLDVARSADDLLPSIDFIFGYNMKGDEMAFEQSDNMIFMGVTLDFPFPDQVDRAEYYIDEIEERKSRLTTNNVYYSLYNDIKNLALAIKREEKLYKIADDKIELAQDVLEAESENYTYGKVTLNDYIDAVNSLDRTRFNKVTHEQQLRKYKIEWLRLTDKLISRSEIR